MKILANAKIPVTVAYEPTQFYETGSYYLDYCFGGGLPVGRITTLWGREGLGKTTLALLAAKRRVDAGGYVAYIDAENALDPAWAARFGLAFDGTQRFFLIQPDSAETALNAILRLLKMARPDDKTRSLFDLIILDSIAALTTEAELKGELGDKVVAGRAQALAQFCSASKGLLRNSTTALLFINQERDKFGMSFGYGEPVQQPGGRAPRFYASIIAKMKGSPERIVEGGKPVGNIFRLKTTKNKVAPPMREAAIRVYFDTGTVDVFSELAAVGHELGVFCKADGTPMDNKKGAWHFLRDDGPQKLGVGETNVADFLDANREIAAEVEAAVRAAIAAESQAAITRALSCSEPFWEQAVGLLDDPA